MKKELKICDIVTFLLFWGIIITLGTGIFLLPQKSFSKVEGRRLASFPECSVESVIDGSFFEGLCDFYSDHLPLRQYFGNIYALSELSIGKREVNGTILCSNGALVLRHTQANESTLKKNIEAISNISRNEIQTVFFEVPDPSSVFADYMPIKTLTNRNEAISNECYGQFLERISEDPSHYYYLTDHHWTTHGAYQAYTIICQRFEIAPFDKDFFDIEIACEDFYGSAFRRSSLPRSLISPDEISLYRYIGDGELLLTDHSTQRTSKGLYDFDEINNGDAYRVFLGGNSAHVSIEATPSEPRKRLLVLKDSYANSLVPFLALHYDIDMIDPRYAEPSHVKELCESKAFDAVLVLLSESTLTQESSISYTADTISKYVKKS